MATGALDTNGIWQYGEDDSNTTFSALLNRLGSSTSTKVGSISTQISARKILQVKSFSYQGVQSTTSTSFVSSGTAVSITPSSTTSKILIIASSEITAGATYGFSTLMRNGANIFTGTNGTGAFGTSGSLASLTYLDSPNTTSAVTYAIGYRSSAGATMYLNTNGGVGTITVMEIAA